MVDLTPGLFITYVRTSTCKAERDISDIEIDTASFVHSSLRTVSHGTPQLRCKQPLLIGIWGANSAV